MTAVKIYPSVEECKIKNLVKCSEEGCSAVFMCESNYKMHLTMTHKKTQQNKIEPEEKKEYYCPVETCVYHEKKHMKSLKSLRQHYLKVHTEKDYICVYCAKVYSSLGMLNRHMDFCGISFNCCECQAKYDCYETLRTHCRRKDHHVHEKNEYKKNYIETSLRKNVSDPEVNCRYQVTSDNNSVCCGRKEDIKPKSKSKMTQVKRTVVYVPQYTKFTVYTQTDNSVSVETQTIGDCVAINKLVKKNSNTQTDIVELQSTGCNTSFNLDETIDAIELKEKNSSSTQTNCGDSQNIFNPTITHYSIHTDTSDLMMEDNLSNLDPFLNCNTETQTDFEMISFGDILNGFSLTDNQTQTVFGSIDISSDKCDIFGSTDNQTQTVFDDLLRSVESQTMMSHVKKNSGNYMSTMETQTDNEFREMLEIINS